MEDTLKLILGKLDLLEKGQKALEQGQKSLEQRQMNLEQGQKELKTEVKGLREDLSKLVRKVDAIAEQTAGLLEFKTEVTKQLEKHEIDIQVLKRALIS